jgi:hypothetical protein
MSCDARTALCNRAQTRVWEAPSMVGEVNMDTSTLLIIVVVLFLLGGGGWGYSRYRRN